MYLLDISRQLACMKLGSREKYQPIQYCWVHTSRLLGYLVSYMPFAYRYPTNLLQRTDRTAFTLAALMLSCLLAVTIIIYCIIHSASSKIFCVLFYTTRSQQNVVIFAKELHSAQ